MIEAIVDSDVSKFPALEAGFMVAGMAMSEGHIVVAASPPDLSVGDSDLFFLGQKR